MFGGQSAGPGWDQRGSGSLLPPFSLVNPLASPSYSPSRGGVPPREADCTGPVRRRQAPSPPLEGGPGGELVNWIGVER